MSSSIGTSPIENNACNAHIDVACANVKDISTSSIGANPFQSLQMTFNALQSRSPVHQKKSRKICLNVSKRLQQVLKMDRWDDDGTLLKETKK